jgi:hypothetical protein
MMIFCGIPKEIHDFYCLTFMTLVLNQRVCSHASLGSTCYIFHAVSDRTGEPKKS